MKDNIKETITEVKKRIKEVNEILNEAIAEDMANNEDRQTFRKIRDENIDTYVLIERMQMVGLI